MGLAHLFPSSCYKASLHLKEMVNQTLHFSRFNIWSWVPFQSKQCQERPLSHRDWLMAIAAGIDWELTLCWALCPEHYRQMVESPQHHQAGRAIHIPSHRWGNWGLAMRRMAFDQGLMLAWVRARVWTLTFWFQTRNQGRVSTTYPHPE